MKLGMASWAGRNLAGIVYVFYIIRHGPTSLLYTENMSACLSCLSVTVVSPLRVLQPRLAIGVGRVGGTNSRISGLVPHPAVVVAC